MICNENNLVSKHSHYDILLPIVCQLSAKLGGQRLKLKRGFRSDFFLYSRKQFLVDSNDSIYTDLQHFKIKQINVGGQIVNYSQCQEFFAYSSIAVAANNVYICTCVFHSIRFKVNNDWGVQRYSFFLFLPYDTACHVSNLISARSSNDWLPGITPLVAT